MHFYIFRYVFIVHLLIFTGVITLKMILITALLVLLGIVFLMWLSGFLFGAAFQSSSDKAIEKMIKLSQVKKGEKVAELGSGNGKLVIAFAKKGAKVTGFEINPFLVWWSRRRIKKLGLQKRAFIKKENFWNADLSGFDIVSVFQVWHVMGGIEKKLKKELKKKNARVVSNTWRLRGMKPAKIDRNVFLYKF